MGTWWPRSAQFSAVTPRTPPTPVASVTLGEAGWLQREDRAVILDGLLPAGEGHWVCALPVVFITIKKAMSKHKIETEPAAPQLWRPRRVHRQATPAPSGSPVVSNKCLLRARQTQIRRWGVLPCPGNTQSNKQKTLGRPEDRPGQ